MKRSELIEWMRQANPEPVEPVTATPRRSVLRRCGQALLALAAIVVVGTGVAWAASGVNPIASALKKDLKVAESPVGLDSFSILEPMTQERFDEMKRPIASLVAMSASTQSFVKRLANRRQRRARGLPPAKDGHGHRLPDDPGLISAIGYGHFADSEVTLMVMNDQMCAYWGAFTSNCGRLEMVESGDLVWSTPERRHPHLARLYSVVPDGVAAVRVAGSDRPAIPVSDNVYEVRNLELKDVRLIGLDADGNELFRTGVRLSFLANF